MVSNPYLPSAPAELNPDHTRQHRAKCGLEFQNACLEFSQSLWLQNKPAQAILQLNKSAFSETGAPFPYDALRWFLENQQDEHFIGNPVRHFQHLATRVAGPRAEIRKWQAWACFHLSRNLLPSRKFPPDHEQIVKENLTLPSLSKVTKNLSEPDRLAFLATLSA